MLHYGMPMAALPQHKGMMNDDWSAWGGTNDGIALGLRIHFGEVGFGAFQAELDADIIGFYTRKW